jgi:hypothetical protein
VSVVEAKAAGGGLKLLGNKGVFRMYFGEEGKGAWKNFQFLYIKSRSSVGVLLYNRPCRLCDSTNLLRAVMQMQVCHLFGISVLRHRSV